MKNTTHQRMISATARTKNSINHRNRGILFKHEAVDIDDDIWLIDDDQTRVKAFRDRSNSPNPKRRCSILDYDLSSSNDIELLHLDVSQPIGRDPSIQLLTPQPTIRSRQPSTTSSINTTIVLSPPIASDIPSRIIRCLANTHDRLTEDKKLRIPM